MDAETAIDEREVYTAAQDVINRLLDFDVSTRHRILRTAQAFLFPDDAGPVHSLAREDRLHGSRPTSFEQRTELTPKEFMFQKQPHTDVDRVACLAYYLTHYRDTRHFKTTDISLLNTEAAQLKFSNTAYAVVNAANAGLLVPAGKGAKQLSAAGERYVESLPDRIAAKEILTALRHRRRRKSVKNGALGID